MKHINLASAASLIAVLALPALPALAQQNPASAEGPSRANGLSFSGSTRIRYEAIDGQARVGFNESDELINLRTILHVEYRRERVRFGGEMFDSRIWGDKPGTPVSTGEVNALEPVQVYIAADFDGTFGEGTQLTLTAGRMMLNLGSRRLVAADDYRNTTNGYTGLRADIAAPREWKATLIYTLPQIRLPDDDDGLRNATVELDQESSDFVLWGGHVYKASAIGQAMAELTYFHLSERDAADRPTRDRALDTVGGRLIVEPRAGAFDYEVEALYQTGHVGISLAAAAPSLSVSSNFVHADVGYSFVGSSRRRVSVEFDRASGDELGGKFERFDTLFGMRRADLAPSGLYNALARTNITTSGVRVEATPSQRLDWFVVYRAMWLAADEDAFSSTGVRDPTGQSGDFAGHQIEGRIRYWILPARLRLEFDGVLLAKGPFLRDAPNAPPGRWTRYGSINLTANF